MQILILLAALLAATLAGCPSVAFTPMGNAPWNDPCWSDNCEGAVLLSGSPTGGGYSGPEYHYVWVDGAYLYVQFQSAPFRGKRTQETGAGDDQIDTSSNIGVQSDITGFGASQGWGLKEDRAHARTYFLKATTKWPNGEKFRLKYSWNGVLGYIPTMDAIAGPGVRAYDREKFVFDNTKTY